MSLLDETACLRRVPLFANVEDSKLKLLAFTSERIVFEPGEDLCVQGETGEEAFIILAGTADVLVHGRDECGANCMIPVAEVGFNDIVGEISVLCDVPRTATVRARTELVALCVEKDVFYRLIMEFPKIAIEIMRVLAERIERTTARLRLATIAGDESKAPRLRDGAAI